MAFLQQLASFNKSSLQKTSIRVRTRDGKIYEEKIDDNGSLQQHFKGEEAVPTFLTEGANGVSSLIPSFYDPLTAKWQPLSLPCTTTTSPSASEDTATLRDQPDSLSFVTYNVWFSDWCQRERAQALCDLVEQRQPDIICFQEVTEIFLEVLKEQQWVRQHYYLSDSSGRTVYPYGVLMLTKMPIKINQLSLHWIPTNQGRRFLKADVDVPLSAKEVSRVRVGTVHLESMDNAEMRAQQLTQIFEILTSSKDNNCNTNNNNNNNSNSNNSDSSSNNNTNSSDNNTNIFLMGDFNFDPVHLSQENLIKQHHFTDTWPTLHASPGHTITDHPSRIDRIVYLSPSFTPSSVSLLGTDPFMSRDNKPVHPSDHFGLHAVFKLKPS